MKQQKLVFVSLAFLAGVVLVTNYNVQARNYDSLYLKEIETIAGRLEIIHIDKNDPMEGEKLILGGRLVATLRYTSSSIVSTHPDDPIAKLILLKTTAHSKSCPYLYRILEIKPDNKAILTDEFGNCDLTAEPEYYKVKENPVFVNGVWRIALSTPMPAHIRKRFEDEVARSKTWKKPSPLPDHLKMPVEWFEYRDGKVLYNGQPVPSPSSDPGWLWRKKLEYVVPDRKQREDMLRTYGSAEAAYRAWLINKANKVQPEKFRGQ